MFNLELLYRLKDIERTRQREGHINRQTDGQMDRQTTELKKYVSSFHVGRVVIK